MRNEEWLLAIWWLGKKNSSVSHSDRARPWRAVVVGDVNGAEPVRGYRRSQPTSVCCAAIRMWFERGHRPKDVEAEPPRGGKMDLAF